MMATWTGPISSMLSSLAVVSLITLANQVRRCSQYTRVIQWPWLSPEAKQDMYSAESST